MQGLVYQVCMDACEGGCEDVNGRALRDAVSRRRDFFLLLCFSSLLFNVFEYV